MKQLLYNPSVPPAQLSAPNIPRVEARPEVFSAGQQIFDRGLDALSKFVDASIKVEDMRQKSIAEYAYTQGRTQMLKWANEYKRTHQGIDALQAQQDYENQWATISKSLEETYGKKLEGVNLFAFNKSLEQGRLFSIQDGGQYQDVQQAAFNKNQDLAELALIEQEIAQNPGDVDRIELMVNNYLEGWARRNPGMDTTALKQKVMQQVLSSAIIARLGQGDISGAQSMLSGVGGSTGGAAPVAGGLGAQVAKWESGKEGWNAISWDQTGGTSFGRYQFTEKSGSMQNFLHALASSGAEGKAAADAIRADGSLSSEATKKAWREEVSKNPELFERVGHDFAVKEFYQPMLSKLSDKVRTLIEENDALQEAVWSTALQHGPSGGAQIVKKIWRDGMTPSEFANALYEERGKHFPSSTEEVRASVKKRFVEENAQIQELLQSGWRRDGGTGKVSETAPASAQNINSTASNGAQPIQTQQNQTRVQEFYNNFKDLKGGELQALLVSLQNEEFRRSMHLSEEQVQQVTAMFKGEKIAQPAQTTQTTQQAVPTQPTQTTQTTQTTQQSTPQSTPQSRLFGGVVLSPQTLWHLQTSIDSAKKKLESRFSESVIHNHVEYALQTGNFNALNEDVAGLSKVNPEKGAQLAQRANAVKYAHQVLNDSKGLPFAERQKVVDNIFSQATPDNAAQISAIKNHVASQLQHEKAQFVKDPGGFVAQLPAMQDPKLSLKDRADLSLKLQAEIGKGLGFTPTILGKEQAAALRSKFDDLATAQEKAQFINGIYSQYGQHYTETIIDEMKLPMTVSFTVPLIASGGLTSKELGTWFLAATMKSKDIEDKTKESGTTSQDALKKYQSTALYEGLKNATRFDTSNERWHQTAKSIEDTATRYIQLGGDIDEFVDNLTISSSDNSFIFLPKKSSILMQKDGSFYSADDLARMANFAKKDILEEIRKIQIRDKKSPASLYNVTRLFNDIYFVNNDTDIIVMDAQTKLPVDFGSIGLKFFGDKKLRTSFGIKDLIKKYYDTQHNYKVKKYDDINGSAIQFGE